MATYFSDLCAADGSVLPANDQAVRAFLESTGAAFSRKPGAVRIAERLEAAAAVSWARTHINDDAA